MCFLWLRTRLEVIGRYKIDRCLERMFFVVVAAFAFVTAVFERIMYLNYEDQGDAISFFEKPKLIPLCVCVFLSNF